MALILDGTLVPVNGEVTFNGTSLDKVTYNGTTVWTKKTEEVQSLAMTVVFTIGGVQSNGTRTLSIEVKTVSTSLKVNYPVQFTISYAVGSGSSRIYNQTLQPGNQTTGAQTVATIDETDDVTFLWVEFENHDGSQSFTGIKMVNQTISSGSMDKTWSMVIFYNL